VAAIDGGGFMAFHRHCVVTNRLCPILLDLVILTIIADVCGEERVLRHSIKFIAPPKVKVRVALMGARTLCTSFVRSFECIITGQIPVRWTLDEQRFPSQNLQGPLHRHIVRRIL
jgi:hypothetical protein